MYKLKQSLLSVIIGLALVAGISYAAPWVGPTDSPPEGNVDAPINAGIMSQVKKGALAVSGVFMADSRAIFKSKINIGNDLHPATAGDIRWTGSDFEGYVGNGWKSFTAIGDGGSKAVLTQNFTSNGVFKVPSGVTKVWVSGVGGGGGGAGANNNGAWTVRAAGGGGGGAAVINKMINGVSGNINVVVGAGGAGGSDNDNNGIAFPGRASSFGSFLTLSGGGGGHLATGGVAGGSGGQKGQDGRQVVVDDIPRYFGGKGGDTLFDVGGAGGFYDQNIHDYVVPSKGKQGSGGGGSNNDDINGASGGNGFIVVKWCPAGLVPSNGNIDSGMCE